MPNPITEAMREYPHAKDDYHVQDVGRPGNKPEEAARRNLRRITFGKLLRSIREGAGLSISEAARQAGMTSSRKLAQYETTCYPPGRIVERLAPIYGMTPESLAQMVLKHSDPEMFEALTGRPGYQPSRQAISDYLAAERDGTAEEDDGWLPVPDEDATPSETTTDTAAVAVREYAGDTA